MRWIAYLGPSPSRDVPGVGEMVRHEPVLVQSEAVAERLLASPSFGEFTPPEGKAPAKPAEAEGEE